ncbi:hypothetical protein, partial [Vibrio lentus]|uniref:hypothetical protein n=1 Tax=Vibrio lentus TaxID=136468 RepID=UPI001A7E096E
DQHALVCYEKKSQQRKLKTGWLKEVINLRQLPMYFRNVLTNIANTPPARIDAKVRSDTHY